MKEETPFNRLPLPPSLLLEAPGPARPEEGQAQVAAAEKKRAARKSRSKTKPKTKRLTIAVQQETISMKKKCKLGWQELKYRLGRKLGQLDQERLKAVLKACGIGAAVITGVLLLVKLMPVAVTLLTILGLGAAMALWDRVRYRPLPF